MTPVSAYKIPNLTGYPPPRKFSPGHNRLGSLGGALLPRTTSSDSRLAPYFILIRITLAQAFLCDRHRLTLHRLHLPQPPQVISNLTPRMIRPPLNNGEGLLADHRPQIEIWRRASATFLSGSTKAVVFEVEASSSSTGGLQMAPQRIRGLARLHQVLHSLFMHPCLLRRCRKAKGVTMVTANSRRLGAQEHRPAVPASAPSQDLPLASTQRPITSRLLIHQRN